MPRLAVANESKSYMYLGPRSSGSRTGPGPKSPSNAPVRSSISTMPPGCVVSVAAPIMVMMARPRRVAMTLCGMM
jgi:hypothetical protein